MMNKIYQKPSTQVCAMEALECMLNVSGGTSNPKDGGDPTGGSSTSPNPFGARSFENKEGWDDSDS